MIKSNETQDSYKQMDESFIALNLVKNNSKVLSCGCGTGREVRFLVKERCCEVTAIDIQKEYLNKSKEVEPLAEYLCENFVYFRRQKSFDCIVCLWNTINYLNKEERKRFIENCKYNLKDNGVLIITTQNIFSKWRAMPHNIKNIRDYYYFPSQIRYWFKDTKLGINELKIGTFNLIIGNKMDL